MRPPCVYCGLPATTRDHVPAKLLLSGPVTRSRTTVNACGRCNAGLSRDQEYFLAVLAQVSQAPTIQDGLAPGGRLDRMLRRNPRLASRLRRQLEVREGRVWIAPELDRIRRVAIATSQGLYSARYGAVASTGEFTVVAVGPTDAVLNGGISASDLMGLFSERFRAKRWSQVQPGVFEYAFVRDGFREQLLCFAHYHRTLLSVVRCPNPRRRYRVSRGHLARHEAVAGPVLGA